MCATLPRAKVSTKTSLMKCVEILHSRYLYLLLNIALPALQSATQECLFPSFENIFSFISLMHKKPHLACLAKHRSLPSLCSLSKPAISSFDQSVIYSFFLVSNCRCPSGYSHSTLFFSASAVSSPTNPAILTFFKPNRFTLALTITLLLAWSLPRLLLLTLAPRRFALSVDLHPQLLPWLLCLLPSRLPPLLPNPHPMISMPWSTSIIFILSSSRKAFTFLSHLLSFLTPYAPSISALIGEPTTSVLLFLLHSIPSS